jgi:hypothetical protein
VRDAIRATCTTMLEPPISNLGVVNGTRKAITETRKWPKLLDDQTLHPDRLLTDATEPMLGIADREEELWVKLRAAIRAPSVRRARPP